MNCDKNFVKAADTEGKEIEKQRGASLVEYALLVALIAVVAIAALTALGGGVSAKFSSVNSSLAGATN
jgi:pilus assembly protein Flp/PilA